MTEPNIGVRELLSALNEKTDDGIVRRTFGITIKAGTLDEKRRCVRVIASTDSVDSYEEVVEQDWEKRLDRYKKNPVVLYNHNRVGFLGLGGAAADTLPVGYSENVAMVDGHLEATLCFVDADANPMAERVWQGFKQGSIRAVSVGFLPHSVYEETDNDRDILHLADNELYEISAVAVPANADAVALSAGQSSERERLRARARAVATKITSAAAEPTENDMDPKEMESKLKAAEALVLEQKTKIEGFEKSAKAAEETQEASKTRIKTLETELKEANDNLEKANTEIATLKSAKGETEDKLIEREVDDLVGKKITPAEKADMIELRKTNKKLFDSTIKNRPDLVHTKTIVKDQNKTKTGSTVIANAQKKSA